MKNKTGFCSAHRDGEDSDCKICYPNEITLEQKAEKIAEWLGFKQGPRK